MTTYAVQSRRADGLVARLIILILILIMVFLVVDRYGWPLHKASAVVEAPATLPADWLDYSEATDAHQTDGVVIEARRVYMVTHRMGCDSVNSEKIAPGVKLVTCRGRHD